jgi:release factor glutamine methyltransferase
MITIIDAIKLTTEYLDKKQVESPRVNAEILLAEVLNCKRINLYLSFDKPLNDLELTKYRELIKKRSNHTPLQYIIGNVEFYGIKLLVDESVLIPRPETELLVETIIKKHQQTNNLKILDIGSGSGNISLALAKSLPGSLITGIDISQNAIGVSLKNLELNKIENVEFKQFDILINDPESLGKFDIIVSNPPYVSLSDYNELEPELKDFEPRIALTDNLDGTSFYKVITQKSEVLLNKPGFLYFELGKGLNDRVAHIMENQKLSNITIIKDYSGIERIIFGELQ